MSGAVDLLSISRAGAERFLQTVLVIDNELFLGRPDPVTTATLTSPKSRFGGRGPVGGEAGVAPAAESASIDAALEGAGVDASASPLDVKSIMDAFLKRSLICGMHKPMAGNDLVAEAIKAARRSDAVIVDWLLQGSDSTAAEEIVSGILDGDRAEHGRLRLIVVYTSEADVADIAAKLKKRLAPVAFEDAALGTLTSRDARIVVLNKEGTKGAKETVSVDGMPARIIEEFARLSEGLLSTFAVSAVAAVRRSTHHILAVFSSEMDGAYLAHRCALKSPDDATEFALELLGGELRGVVAMSEETVEVLSQPSLAEWIARRADGGGRVHGGPLSVPLEVATGFVAGGETAVEASKLHQVRTGAEKLSKDEKKPGKDLISARNVGLLFHDDATSAEASQGRFARLAGFKIEPYGRRVPPSGWVPTLSLGSLLVHLGAGGDPSPRGYLLCTQPRCDAVRITTTRGFPFQTGFQTPEAPFHVVAALPGTDDKPTQVLINIGYKPFQGVMIEFKQNKLGRVMATKTDKGFVFSDTDGCRYLWLGDLRDLTAQRAASVVAARLHEVGLDEYEWVRRHNTKPS